MQTSNPGLVVAARSLITPDTPLQSLKGVGTQISAALAKLNLFTVYDLFWHIPRRWEDRTRFAHARDLKEGEYAALCAIPLSVSTTHPRPHLSLTKALLDDYGSPLSLVWFNQPYIEKSFKKLISERRQVVIYGMAKRTGWTCEISHPEWEPLNPETEPLSANRIVPIYPATEGLGQARLRRLVFTLLQSCSDQIEETLPEGVIARYHLMDARTAINNIHFPSDMASKHAAHRRLVFEEFFLLQTALAVQRKAEHLNKDGIIFSFSKERWNDDLKAIVPFSLTNAQHRAIDEITSDLVSGHVMNRLLQGDVGSGKTMVALAALLIAVRSGYQAALMAPTEILAQQHAIVLRRLLEPLGIQVELATGSGSEKTKRAARERILSGEASIVVGTHALIQEGIEFHKLGLAVIDEQHRFGVLQRQALSKKGVRPHILVMTATPIPRTLTMTLYGDLDISILDELPPGRKPIITHWKSIKQRLTVYAGVKKLLDQGTQAYIVCPLVEESDKLEAKSAIQMYQHISTELFPDYRVGLIHGQLSPKDKEDVMAQFKRHELDVLVATTVIEVGIDVPNASAILIEDADRFGLAQLHQLRGRVGRGGYASYCILIADPKTEEGKARMDIMAQTNDGFRIADEDMRLRGPGDFCGVRQSGLQNLRIANIFRDMDVLTETRSAAFDLVESDPLLQKNEHLSLHRAIERNRKAIELINVS